MIRTPYNKPISEIQQIIQIKKGWIFKKHLEFKKRTSEIPIFTYKSGTKLPYLGQNYTLTVLKGQKKEGIAFSKKGFFVNLKTNDLKQVKSLYEKWLFSRAQKIFENKIKLYSTKLGLKPEKIIIKNLKNRWGSTTKNNIINLNMNLIKTPQEIIGYVILHELCHLKIKDHSYHFWDLVRKFMPNYPEKKCWLEVNSTRIVD